MKPEISRSPTGAQLEQKIALVKKGVTPSHCTFLGSWPYARVGLDVIDVTPTPTAARRVA